uniref:Uncharacterized protein n=1 Tax=Spironucleus salmonicida TaxID=348837 RepID=V6LFJ3_9EUKA|eukprot:EST43063.1 Hypothetical protein SS50377_17366 [Spironucleus salmonicida]
MSEILLGFDIDSAAVCYDFQSQNAYFTPRSHFAILSRTNVLNQLRRSKNYGQRLIKYANRGFQIAIPGFSRNCQVVQKLTKNADLVDQKCHFRTKNEQVYLEGLVRQEKAGNLLCSSEINQIIEAEIGSSVNFLGIDQKFYQQQCRLVGVVLQNTRIENRIQNEKNRMARNLQTEANRGFKQSMAVVQGCVQDDKVGENPVSYNLTKHTETDVLSHQFAFQSDYCIPTSFGFHSQNAIEYLWNIHVLTKPLHWALSLVVCQFRYRKPRKVGSIHIKLPPRQFIWFLWRPQIILRVKCIFAQ